MAKKKYDWKQLHIMFINGNETPNEFRIRHGINRGYFYKKIDVREWIKDRQEIEERSMKKTKEKFSNELTKKWSKYTNVNSRILDHVEKLLKRYLPPTDLRAVAHSVEICLKSDRLIHGQPTESIETQNNFHLQLVEAIEQINRTNNSTTTATISTFRE